jgi:hypothetical protein
VRRLSYSLGKNEERFVLNVEESCECELPVSWLEVYIAAERGKELPEKKGYNLTLKDDSGKVYNCYSKKEFVRGDVVDVICSTSRFYKFFKDYHPLNTEDGGKEKHRPIKDIVKIGQGDKS